MERAGAGNTVSLYMDDQPIERNVVPLPAPGQKEVTVEVTLQ